MAPRVAVTALCWLLTVPLAAWAVVRVLGLERGYPLVPLFAFTPYVAAGGLLVVALDALVRRWRAAAVAAVAVVALAAGLVPRALGDGGRGTGGPPLRILTANLHLGEVPPEAVVELVRRHDVDILSVQEVDDRAAARLREAGIERVLPRAIVRTGPAWHGSALYARVPLEARPGPAGTLNEIAVGRGRWPGVGAFEVLAVHPPPPTRGGIERWAADLRRLPPAPARGSRILAGDFNATLDHDRLRDLLDSGYADAAASVGAGFRATWPARGRLPGVAIDHVLLDRHWRVRRVSFHPLPSSDHRAVLVEAVPAP